MTLSLVYHNENYAGTLDDISISLANSYGVLATIDYLGPESVNDLHRFRDVYGFPDSLSRQDSVKVLRGLSGAFWIRGSTNVPQFIGNYSWKDSLYVQSER